MDGALVGARLHDPYIIIVLLSIFLGSLGFLEDYATHN
jgi:hypothetical protein